MDFKFEQLSQTIKIAVSKEHTFGTDAFLLSDFAAPKTKETVCDLGTGCGIIPMLMEKNAQPKQIYCVDIQPKAIEGLEISIKESGLQQKLIPILADLKDLKGKVPFGAIDLVTCNPPYKAAGAGILSELTAEQIARHEVLCTIYDVCKTASQLLRFGGRLCVCQRPERLVDVLDAMRQNGIEPKRLEFVAKDSQSEPWLFLAEGKKGSKPHLRINPTKIVVANKGNWSIK